MRLDTDYPQKDTLLFTASYSNRPQKWFPNSSNARLCRATKRFEQTKRKSSCKRNSDLIWTTVATVLVSISSRTDDDNADAGMLSEHWALLTLTSLTSKKNSFIFGDSSFFGRSHWLHLHWFDFYWDIIWFWWRYQRFDIDYARVFFFLSLLPANTNKQKNTSMLIDSTTLCCNAFSFSFFLGLCFD